MIWNPRTLALTALGIAAAATLAVELAVLFTRGQGTTPPPRPAPVPEATRLPLLSPFTGERVPALRRVLAVKIGNTVPERPATGLAGADLAYVIPVEGGLSRILAVYSSHYPPVIGQAGAGVSGSAKGVDVHYEVGGKQYLLRTATQILVPDGRDCPANL